MGVRDPVGGPGPPAVKTRSLPSSGTRGVTGPVPERGAGPGPLVWQGKSRTRGARLLRPLWRSYGWLRESWLAAVGVGIPATGYRQSFIDLHIHYNQLILWPATGYRQSFIDLHIHYNQLILWLRDCVSCVWLMNHQVDLKDHCEMWK
jgi:hypothetical protein